MYVHIGGECTLLLASIIGIFDLDKTSSGAQTEMRKFLLREEEEGRLENIPGSLPLSVVVSAYRTFLSPLSVHTLEQRILAQEASLTEN